MEDAELSLGKLEEVGAAGGSWGKLVEKSLLQTLNRIARTRATNRRVDKPYTKKDRIHDQTYVRLISSQRTNGKVLYLFLSDPYEVFASTASS